MSRDHALMTAFFAGQTSQWDWKKAPTWPDFLNRMTMPPRKLTDAEIAARLEAWTMSGLAVET